MENETIVRSIPYVNRNNSGRMGRVIDVDEVNKKYRVEWNQNPDGSPMKKPFRGWISWKNTQIIDNSN